MTIQQLSFTAPLYSEELETLTFCDVFVTAESELDSYGTGDSPRTWELTVQSCQPTVSNGSVDPYSEFNANRITEYALDQLAKGD